MHIAAMPLSRSAIEIVGIALAYFLLGITGQLFSISPGNVTPVWPPSGFALAIVFLLGKRGWLGIFLGALIVNVYAFFESSTQDTITTSIATGISIGIGSLI